MTVEFNPTEIYFSPHKTDVPGGVVLQLEGSTLMLAYCAAQQALCNAIAQTLSSLVQTLREMAQLDIKEGIIRDDASRSLRLQDYAAEKSIRMQAIYNPSLVNPV